MQNLNAGRSVSQDIGAPAHVAVASEVERWRECAHCGFVCELPSPRRGHNAACPRCDHILWRMRRSPFEFPLACCVAALFFYLYALVAPFIEISTYGRFQLARIATGPVQLTAQGFQLVGLLVLAVTIIFPGIKLGLMGLTLLGIETHALPVRLMKLLFRYYAPISPWAMIDVYLLGFLVAYTRLTGMASVHLDTALYALIGFMIVMAAADASLDTEAAWRVLDSRAHHGAPPPAPQAAEPGQCLVGCHGCGMLNLAEPGQRCRRCHGVLRARKTDSLNRSWAFLVAAAFLYIPANLYPVMELTQLTQTQSFTIMGGIAELVRRGLWPLALLVFFASITIPLMKLLILGYMLVQTQRGAATHLTGRTWAFRFIEFIGRWSMIDVFMISILVALVRFEQFANVRADTGATCFAAVVVLTMFAVMAFDPRLMWDNAEARESAAA